MWKLRFSMGCALGEGWPCRRRRKACQLFLAMEAVPPGTCLIALKGVYGVNDAPNLWGGRHAEGILENGATESALAPRTLILSRD